MDVIIFIFQSDVSSSVVECKGSAFTDDSQPLVTSPLASSSVVLPLWSQYPTLVYTWPLESFDATARFQLIFYRKDISRN